MIVTIIPITDHKEYSINGKNIYKVSKDKWECNAEMSNEERSAFQVYEKTVINNHRFKKHTKSIYKR